MYLFDRNGGLNMGHMSYQRSVRMVLLVAICFIASCSEIDPSTIQIEKGFSLKLMPLSEAYAKNSINTSVFRTNSICSDNNYQLVSYFDPDGYVTFAKRRLGHSKWIIKKTNFKCDCTDAHNGISIALDGDGYIHLAYNQHSNRLTYRKSLTPYSIDFGDLQYMVNSEEENVVTYPEFYRKSNGNLIFVYRNGQSGNGNCVMNEYDLKTQQWSRTQSKLLDGEGQRNAYWQICIDKKDIIYTSWVWRESSLVESNHDMCYAFSTNSGYDWFDSKSRAYKTPIGISNAEIAWSIPQNSELINQTSMTTDSWGHPYIATYWREEDVPQYRIIYNDGVTWGQMQVSKRTTPFSLSGGGTKRTQSQGPEW